MEILLPVLIMLGFLICFIRCEKCAKCGYMRESGDVCCPKCTKPFPKRVRK